MMAKTNEISDGEFYIVCPGCKFGHSFNVKENNPDGVGGFMPVWTFNGDLEKPTFRASLLVKYTERLTDDQHALIMRGEAFKPRDMVCHSFVTDGKIEFLTDCTHDLAGQTVELKDVD